MPSTVQYGVVSMEQIKTRMLEHRQVLDLRKTYLYTRIKIEFLCILNPALNSYFMDATGAVFAGGSNEGPAIVKAIRHYLAQPRRQLIITHGNTEVLRSPLNGVPCDCTSGPTVPEAPVVTEVVGGKSLWVRFVVQTDINECRGNKGPLPGGGIGNVVSPMLSHTWEMQEDLDKQGLSVRTVTGRAVFRDDQLQQLLATPDDFREWLFFPIDNDRQRDQVRSLATDDGLECRYSFVDREVYCRILGNNIAHIEGEHSVSLWSPGTIFAITESARTAFQLGSRTADLTLQFLQSRSDPVQSRIALGAGIFEAAGHAAFDLALSLATKAVSQTSVRVFGYSGTGHDALSLVAHRVAASRAPTDVNWYNAKIIEIRHLNKPLVEVQTVFEVTNYQAAVFQEGRANQTTLATYFTGGTVAPGARGDMTFTSGPGKMFPGNSKSRGRLVADMVGQALVSGCSVRVAPVAPPATQNLTP